MRVRCLRIHVSFPNLNRSVRYRLPAPVTNQTGQLTTKNCRPYPIGNKEVIVKFLLDRFLYFQFKLNIPSLWLLREHLWKVGITSAVRSAGNVPSSIEVSLFWVLNLMVECLLDRRVATSSNLSGPTSLQCISVWTLLLFRCGELDERSIYTANFYSVESKHGARTGLLIPDQAGSIPACGARYKRVVSSNWQNSRFQICVLGVRIAHNPPYFI